MSNNIAGVKLETPYFRKPKDFQFITFTFPKLLLRDNRIHILSMDSQIQKALLKCPQVHSPVSAAAVKHGTSRHIYQAFITQPVLRPQSELGFQLTRCCVV